MHDVATAAGPNRITTTHNVLWAASDVVQKEAQKSLKPLIEQLFKRACYIMKRLVDIVDRMIIAKRREEEKGRRFPGSTQPLSGDSGQVADDFPYFTSAVKDFFRNYVDELAKSCFSKSMDEFYCTRIIFWEASQTKLVSDEKLDLATATPNEVKQLIEKLATELFNETKKRAIKNVLLKCYNYFFLPIEGQIWGELQGKVTQLSDEAIEEMFQVKSTRQRLQDEDVQLKGVIKVNEEQDNALRNSSLKFSSFYPKLNRNF